MNQSIAMLPILDYPRDSKSNDTNTHTDKNNSGSGLSVGCQKLMLFTNLTVGI